MRESLSNPEKNYEYVDNKQQVAVNLIVSNEQFYRQLLDEQMEIIFRVDVNSTIIFANKSFCDFFSKSITEIQGKHLMELGVFSTNNAQLKAFINLLRPENPVFKQQAPVKRPNGEIVWIEWTEKGLFNNLGQITEIQVVGHDISELKNYQERLRTSRENFWQLAHTAPALIYISQPEDERLLWVNAGFGDFMGYTSEECLALRSWDLIHPDFRAVLKEDSLAILKDRQKRSRQDIKVITKDGKVLWQDLSKSYIEFEGRSAILGVGYDVTERKMAEEMIAQQNLELQASYNELEAMNEEIMESQERLLGLNKQLQESRERLELALWGSDEGLWDWDFSSGEIYFNERLIKMLGYDPQTFVYHIDTWEELTHPADRACVWEKLKEHIQGHTDCYEVEYRLRTNSGDYLWAFDRGKAVAWDESGLVTRIVGMRMDISERKEAEEKIHFLSFHDSLTGLYNRAFASEELRRLDTPRQLPLSIIMGDVNALKLTNDAFGHYEGDKLLKTIACFLRMACRTEDVVARWGGDEFVVILPQTSHKEAYSICLRIQQQCLGTAPDPIQPSIALGAASKETEDQNINEVMAEAEDSMYRNKLLEGNSMRNAIILSLEQSLNERTHETREHARRMQEISVKFARELDLPVNEVERLILLAKLHDIGKLGIPDNILAKPGVLNEEEWETIRKHPEIGFRITQASHDLVSIADEVLSHHERWDGRGYPRSIGGGSIPYLARIISIVDSYDVMTHGRPYKAAISPREALGEIKDCSGGQFDPQLVECFLRVFDSV